MEQPIPSVGRVDVEGAVVSEPAEAPFEGGSGKFVFAERAAE